MEKLYEKLNSSAKVTVYKTDESQFLEWGGFLDSFYRELSGLVVKQNHIFSMDEATCRGKETNFSWISEIQTLKPLPTSATILSNKHSTNACRLLRNSVMLPTSLP